MYGAGSTILLLAILVAVVVCGAFIVNLMSDAADRRKRLSERYQPVQFGGSRKRLPLVFLAVVAVGAIAVVALFIAAERMAASEENSNYGLLADPAAATGRISTGFESQLAGLISNSRFGEIGGKAVT